ncbi:MAG: transporter substrate-binding domain-containing protein [Desulfobacterales bacterium]
METLREKTGQKIEFLPSSWSESLENLKNGLADIHSGLAISPEREKWMKFSQAFYENPSCLFFR